MRYSHLLAPRATLANFREAYGVPGDVDIAYCHKGDIALCKNVLPPRSRVLHGVATYLI